MLITCKVLCNSEMNIFQSVASENYIQSHSHGNMSDLQLLKLLIQKITIHLKEMTMWWTETEVSINIRQGGQRERERGVNNKSANHVGLY